jgi:Tc toxin complex TcA C-terminal TcB-binding domain/Neuraminidase-like domain
VTVTDTEDVARRVHGTLRDRLSRPLEGVTVRALDRDIRTETLLGEAGAVAGRYEISYRATQLRRPGKQTADLVLVVVDQAGQELHRTPVHHGVADDTVLDVMLGERAFKGASEWEILSERLLPLLEGLDPVDVREDATHRDLTFLAGETGYEPMTVATWIAAHRIADKTARDGTALDPALIYAFVGQGQPGLYPHSLEADFASAERLVLLDDTLLRRLADLSPDRQGEILERALDRNLVPTAVEAGAAAAAETLAAVRLRYLSGGRAGPGRGTVAELLALAPRAAGREGDVVRALAGAVGPLDKVLAGVAERGGLPADAVDEVREVFQLGALTRNHVPLVAELLERRRRGEARSVRDFAALSRADWRELVAGTDRDGRPIGPPVGEDGDNAAEQLDHFAARLERSFERAFPTASFAGKLDRTVRSGRVPGRASGEVAHFLVGNPEFELDKHRVEHYLAEHPDAIGDEDREKVTRDLMAVQRVFRLEPTFDGVDALLGLGIESAQQIYFMGPERFAEARTRTSLLPLAGKRIYDRAATSYATALALFGEFNRGLNGIRPAALPDLTVDDETGGRLAALPTLHTLFGSLDYCECTHCESVYSPSAHFVDLLRFLGQRVTAHGVTSVRDVLLARRPDLGDIELSCANTETLVPYIDLVNEILEDAVAPVGASRVDPLVRLQPGPVDSEVVHAFFIRGLPLARDAVVHEPDSRGRTVIRDAARSYSTTALPPEEVTVGGSDFEVPTLETAFPLLVVPSRQTFLSEAELRANPEYANPAAYRRLTGEVFPFDLPFSVWNTEARRYLDHLGVPQARLYELFWRRGEDGTTAPGVHDLALATLGLLPRQIGSDPSTGAPWTYWGLDEVGNIVAGPAGEVTGNWIDVLKNVPVVLQRSGLSPVELVQLLDLRFLNATGQVQLVAAAGGDPEGCDISSLRLFGVDGRFLARLNSFVRVWRTTTGIPMWDLDRLLSVEDAEAGRIRPEALQQIAQLYRLREKTGLNLVALHSMLTGIDRRAYVDRAHGDAPVPSLYDTLFRNRAVTANMPFPASTPWPEGTIAAHRESLLGIFRITDAELTTILTAIAESPILLVGEETPDAIYGFVTLARALRLSIDDFVRLRRLAGDPFEGADAMLTFVEHAGLVAASGFSVMELERLLGVPADTDEGPVGPATFALFVEALQGEREDPARPAAAAPTEADDQGQEYADALHDAARLRLLSETVARILGLDPSLAALLIQALAAPNVNQAVTDLLAGSGVRPSKPLTPETVHAALRLLDKFALLVAKLQLEPAEVTWWIGQSEAVALLGWFRLGDLPYRPGDPPVPFGAWAAVQRFFTWRAAQRAPAEALDLATLLLDDPDSATSVLVRVTGWRRGDVDALLGAFGWSPAPDLRDSRNLVRLDECMRALARLGVTATRALRWVAGSLEAGAGEAIAADVKQALKAKYDLAQWQELFAPIQDELRAARRDALVSFLVAHPDPATGRDWIDTNGLYGHFLIDVEMDPCMLTSRLKQATASVQLFVQRVQLQLEPALPEGPGTDPKWRQWRWMKNYRVWEANRKVFLYPENWIEPELRSHKTPFFLELERELLEGEVTPEAVERAYVSYLRKLETVSNLDIRATTTEYLPANETILHVVGRSRSSATPAHYYRRRVKGRWTAWETVAFEIASDHLVTAVEKGRTLLLWPQFVLKVDQPAGQSAPSNERWEIRLLRSEHKDGRWTPPVMGDSVVELATWRAEKSLENVSLHVTHDPLRVEFYASQEPRSWAPIGRVGFELIGRLMRPAGLPARPYYVSGYGSGYRHNLVRHDDDLELWVSKGTIPEGTEASPDASENAEPVRVLGLTPDKEGYTLVDSDDINIIGLGTFFYRDPNRVYFVEYALSSTSYSGSSGVVVHNKWAFRFHTHFHPCVDFFLDKLHAGGLPLLLARATQLEPGSNETEETIFAVEYGPKTLEDAETSIDPATPTYVEDPYPVEDVDFTYGGAYSAYNWELFFHIPVFVANRLAAHQQFEAALDWYHYVFDPTSTDRETPDPASPQQRYWITKPFYETTSAEYHSQRIGELLMAIARGDSLLLHQVREWRANPFDPHLVATLRLVAYQKNVVVKYIQTVIAWADSLFARDTVESINEATQLYVLASSVLGPRPRVARPVRPRRVKTYSELQAAGIDEFGSTIVELENLLPGIDRDSDGEDDGPELPHLSVLHFPVPHNDKLLALWDLVEDRLFKIRHCMNIAGVRRQLPLFEPPIDPALLVQATAAGLSIEDVLTDLAAPLPGFRFTTTVRQAMAACDDVRALGAALLSAIEKRDAEALALVQSGHEQQVLRHGVDIRLRQIDEHVETNASLQEAFLGAMTRRDHYDKLLRNGHNLRERSAMALTKEALSNDDASVIEEQVAAVLALLPEASVGFDGHIPTVSVSFGGSNISGMLGHVATVSKLLSGIAQTQAAQATMLAGYERRAEDWSLQRELADRELPQINRQILATAVREDVARKEVDNQRIQIENAAAEAAFLRSKFTNQELYEWMVSEISVVYFQAYKLAFDLAKRAERTFQFELGLEPQDSRYIQPGYWDSLKKGLLAGEHLALDVRRLEAAYYERSRREYELTKHVSLAQLEPAALLELRETGECQFAVPEWLFDLDHPGHYFRRIKSVSISIPCVAGPFTSVAATLRLMGDQVRADPRLIDDKYPRAGAEDPRFRPGLGGVHSIATSEPQRDDGLFELSFQDDRYLPFEGAGAISSWRLEMNKELAQFDFRTIADVVLHVSYTAREDAALAGPARAEVKRQLGPTDQTTHGVVRVLDVRHEFPDAWHRFLRPVAAGVDQQLVLDGLAARLPFYTRGFARRTVRRIEVVAALIPADAEYRARIEPFGVETTLAPHQPYGGLHRALFELPAGPDGPELGDLTVKLRKTGAADFSSLPPDSVSELFVILHLAIA